MALNFTHKLNKFTSAGTPIEVRLEVTGLGTPTFRFEIVFEFYSCEVHYDIMGNRTIQPLADHYEPNEIEDWHKDILEDISDH